VALYRDVDAVQRLLSLLHFPVHEKLSHHSD
jgi:hypothetical protein